MCFQQICRDYQDIITIFLPLLKLTVKQLPIVVESQRCPLKSLLRDILAQGSAIVVAARDGPSGVVGVEGSAACASWSTQTMPKLCLNQTSPQTLVHGSESNWWALSLSGVPAILSQETLHRCKPWVGQHPWPSCSPRQECILGDRVQARA